MLKRFLCVVLSGVLVRASDFAGNLANCAANNQLNTCLRQTLEDLRPLMRVGIPALKLPVTEPMNVDTIEFKQVVPPVSVRAVFSNVVVTGLSTFITNYIEADPISRTLRIALTVPQMDIQGFYEIDGEVWVLPLSGNGGFTTKMLEVTAVGSSNIVPVTNPYGRQILQLNNTNIDFNIGKVSIQMNNLFNGENKILADTVNKFLNEHGQEVLKEVKPEISRKLKNLVSRVMNDAFSELPADELLKNLNSNTRGVRSQASTGGSGSFPVNPPAFAPHPAPAAPHLRPSGPHHFPSFQHSSDRKGKSSIISLLTRGRRSTSTVDVA